VVAAARWLIGDGGRLPHRAGFFSQPNAGAFIILADEDLACGFERGADRGEVVRRRDNAPVCE
jgi:hypothetical protein